MSVFFRLSPVPALGHRPLEGLLDLDRADLLRPGVSDAGGRSSCA
jgi:hypothetical protein